MPHIWERIRWYVSPMGPRWLLSNSLGNNTTIQMLAVETCTQECLEIEATVVRISILVVDCQSALKALQSYT